MTAKKHSIAALQSSEDKFKTQELIAALSQLSDNSIWVEYMAANPQARLCFQFMDDGRLLFLLKEKPFARNFSKAFYSVTDAVTFAHKQLDIGVAAKQVCERWLM
jgi:hypothetical protein